jgi:hypothetical protein
MRTGIEVKDSSATFWWTVAAVLFLVGLSFFVSFNFLQRIITSHADTLATMTASVVGFLGFTLTIWQLRQTRTAAQAARKASDDVRQSFVHYDTFIELGRAKESLSALKILHRDGSWAIACDRYQLARHALATVRDLHVGLPASAQLSIEASIEELSRINRLVERYLANVTSRPPNAADLNTSLSGQIDSIHDIETALRKRL